MSKVYISGPITGVADYKEKFEEAAEYLRQNGHIPINPAVECEGLSPADYLRISLARLEAADAIFPLYSWQMSSGAMIEMQYAKYAGKYLCVAERGHVKNVSWSSIYFTADAIGMEYRGYCDQKEVLTFPFPF